MAIQDTRVIPARQQWRPRLKYVGDIRKATHTWSQLHSFPQIAASHRYTLGSQKQIMQVCPTPGGSPPTPTPPTPTHTPTAAGAGAPSRKKHPYILRSRLHIHLPLAQESPTPEMAATLPGTTPPLRLFPQGAADAHSAQREGCTPCPLPAPPPTFF